MLGDSICVDALGASHMKMYLHRFGSKIINTKYFSHIHGIVAFISSFKLKIVPTTNN